jgi:hypothetical protein
MASAEWVAEVCTEILVRRFGLVPAAITGFGLVCW